MFSPGLSVVQTLTFAKPRCLAHCLHAAGMQYTNSSSGSQPASAPQQPHGHRDYLLVCDTRQMTWLRKEVNGLKSHQEQAEGWVVKPGYLMIILCFKHFGNYSSYRRKWGRQQLQNDSNLHQYHIHGEKRKSWFCFFGVCLFVLVGGFVWFFF